MTLKLVAIPKHTNFCIGVVLSYITSFYAIIINIEPHLKEETLRALKGEPYSDVERAKKADREKFQRLKTYNIIPKERDLPGF